MSDLRSQWKIALTRDSLRVRTYLVWLISRILWFYCNSSDLADCCSQKRFSDWKIIPKYPWTDSRQFNHQLRPYNRSSPRLSRHGIWVFVARVGELLAMEACEAASSQELMFSFPLNAKLQAVWGTEQGFMGSILVSSNAYAKSILITGIRTGYSKATEPKSSLLFFEPLPSPIWFPVFFFALDCHLAPFLMMWWTHRRETLIRICFYYQRAA